MAQQIIIMDRVAVTLLFFLFCLAVEHLLLFTLLRPSKREYVVCFNLINKIITHIAVRPRNKPAVDQCEKHLL